MLLGHAWLLLCLGDALVRGEREDGDRVGEIYSDMCLNSSSWLRT